MIPGLPVVLKARVPNLSPGVGAVGAIKGLEEQSYRLLEVSTVAGQGQNVLFVTECQGQDLVEHGPALAGQREFNQAPVAPPGPLSDIAAFFQPPGRTRDLPLAHTDAFMDFPDADPVGLAEMGNDPPFGDGNPEPRPVERGESATDLVGQFGKLPGQELVQPEFGHRAGISPWAFHPAGNTLTSLQLQRYGRGVARPGGESP